METHGIWDLRLQRMDLGVLLRAARDSANAVLGRIQTKTGGEEGDVGSADRGAKSLYWW